MPADTKLEGPLYLFTQLIVKGNLVYELRDTSKWFLFENGAIASSSNGVSGRFYLVPKQVVDPSLKMDVPVDVDDLVQEIANTISEEAGIENNMRARVVAWYAIVSFCAVMFNSLPVLWLIVASPQVRSRLARVLQEVTFNGVVLRSHDPEGIILESLSSQMPTLIFLDENKFSRTTLDLFINYPNTNERKLHMDKSASRNLFSPKIVISEKSPPSAMSPHTLTIPLRHSTFLPADLDIVGIRMKLMHVVQCAYHHITSAISAARRSRQQDDKTFAFGILFTALHSKDTDISEHWKLATAAQYSSRTELQEYLIVTWEFLEEHRGRYSSSGGLFPLGDLATYALKNNEILKNATPKSISQKLNQVPGLIKRSERLRVTNGLSQVRATCVEIDESILKEFIA